MNKGVLLAKTLEAKMKENGLTRSMFAELMNVQPSIITKWLSGNHNFTINTLFDIETALQINLFNIKGADEPANEWIWHFKRNRNTNNPRPADK